MNRPFYRPPAQSRASASTLCQNYECKAPAQQRPYAARPSRTQQLLNPKLAPKLSSDVPNHLLRKKGIADEQLARKDAERGRKRSLEDSSRGARKASRSISSDSSDSDSVSTISTTASRSPSPQRRGQSPPDRLMTSQYEEDFPAPDSRKSKRRRRSVSSSRDSHRSRDPERNTRRRRRSASPVHRGRKNERSRSRSRSHRSTSRSVGPQRTGRRKSRSPNPSRRDRQPSGRPQQQRAPPGPPKERSLSPFSKRLALTQSMNMRG